MDKMWMAVICDMLDEQLLQAKLTNHAITYSRSVTGVHYYDDNLVGEFTNKVISVTKMRRYFPLRLLTHQTQSHQYHLTRDHPGVDSAALHPSPLHCNKRYPF
jgi:hypothetical protein